MPRIVYLSESVIPSRAANSVHVMKMCQAMARTGHDVVLLAPDVCLDEHRGVDPFVFYGVEPVFELKKCAWPSVKGRAYFYAWAAARAAANIQPDLVFGRFLAGCLLCVWHGLPTAYESHTLVDCLGRAQRWMFNRLIAHRHFKRLVVISDALKRDYIERGPGLSERILVAHDCADIPAPVAPLPFAQSDRMQVGYIGHLYAGRGIEIILAMADACPWADFHLIGGMENDVAEWRGKTGRQSNVIFHGFVPPNETARHRQSCDALLAPYQNKVSVQGGGDTSRWMSPLKLFEYMSSGHAMICSDIPVLREVLHHERNAVLCAPDKPGEWIRALERLRDEPDFAKRIGQVAYGDFLEHYTWPKRVEAVLNGLV